MSHTITLDLNNRPLTIEINKVGTQADGSALVRYGDTMMLITATSKKEQKEVKPFLPLIVDYRENTYAAGKIPGGFFKREGRPSEKEILISRLIDRPIRTLFPEGYTYDTQIVAFLLSADLENEQDTLGIIGASTALYFSDIPFTTPLGAVKVGYNSNGFIVNPTWKELEDCKLNMVVVGTEEGIVMIEAGADEIEDERITEGIALAQDSILKIIQAQKDLYAKLDIQKRSFTAKKPDAERAETIEKKITPLLTQAFQERSKKERDILVGKILEDLKKEIPEENSEELSEVSEIFYQTQKKIVRDHIVNNKSRIDGRAFDEIRPISIEVGLLPRTHGSALFTRGETQCLATVTLGTFEDVQRIDTIGIEGEKRFMLHYNFPPFSVGEVAFLRGPGRREIGHGALAEKSILPSIPESEEEFPYTIRIVSDILESNGSSSMATVCGGVLSLMDAGVPLSMVVAGIAMGLVMEGDKHAVLTDIAGMEDHFGDMDLKVAGSEKGITSLQMDLKLPSVPLSIVEEALLKAKDARLQVLSKMKEVLPEPRKDISPFAPRIIHLIIKPDRVADIIGPAGKIIKKIIAQTGAKIDIDDSGRITIASTDPKAANEAKDMIKDLTVEAEIGKTYSGKVIRIEDYGVFIEILPNIVGLLHISEYSHKHTRSIRDEVKMGQIIEVKVIGIDESNKVKVSRKALDPSSQQDDKQNKPDFRNNSYQKKRDPRNRY